MPERTKKEQSLEPPKPRTAQVIREELEASTACPSRWSRNFTQSMPPVIRQRLLRRGYVNKDCLALLEELEAAERREAEEVTKTVSKSDLSSELPSMPPTANPEATATDKSTTAADASEHRMVSPSPTPAPPVATSVPVVSSTATSQAAMSTSEVMSRAEAESHTDASVPPPPSQPRPVTEIAIESLRSHVPAPESHQPPTK